MQSGTRVKPSAWKKPFPEHRQECLWYEALREQLVNRLDAVVYYSNRSATRSRQLGLDGDSQRVINCRRYFGRRGGTILRSGTNFVGCAANLAALDSAACHPN